MYVCIEESQVTIVGGSTYLSFGDARLDKSKYYIIIITNQIVNVPSKKNIVRLMSSSPAEEKPINRCN